MLFSSNRRDFLKGLIGGAAGLSVSRTAFGVLGDSPITATRLTDSLTLLSGAGGNVVVLSAADGLLLVNGTLPERTGSAARLDAASWRCILGLERRREVFSREGREARRERQPRVHTHRRRTGQGRR